MFEIPDDDDLFLEDNIIHIGNDEKTATAVSRQSPSCGKRGPSNCHTLDKSLNDEIKKGGQSSHCKKMRVLSTINSLQEKTGTASPPGKSQTFFEQLTTTSVDKVHDGEIATLASRKSHRRFPGPAGLLPLIKPHELENGVISISDPNSVFGKPEHTREVFDISNTQVTSDDLFSSTSWQSLKKDLEPDASEVLRKFSVKTMLHKARRRQLPKGKVPLMLGVIDSIDLTSEDAGVVVRDQTGQMQGTLHRDVLRDFGAELQAGAAIVLRQVSVISPSGRTHYLNITCANIVAIYPSYGCESQVILPSSSPQFGTSGQTAQETLKTYIHTAQVELVEEGNKRLENSMHRSKGDGSPLCPSLTSAVAGGNQPFSNRTIESRLPHVSVTPHVASGGTPKSVPSRHPFLRSSQQAAAPPAHSLSPCRFTFKHTHHHPLGKQTDTTDKRCNTSSMLQSTNERAKTDERLSSSVKAAHTNSTDYRFPGNRMPGITSVRPSTLTQVCNGLSGSSKGLVPAHLVKSGRSNSSATGVKATESFTSASDMLAEPSTWDSHKQQLTDITRGLWSDELNEDILSQLSDDF